MTQPLFSLNCCHILQSASLDMQALSLGNQTNNGCTTLMGMLRAAYKLAQITQVAQITPARRFPFLAEADSGSSLRSLPAGAVETTKDPPPQPLQ